MQCVKKKISNELIILLVFGILISLIAIIKVPYAVPMPGLLQMAEQKINGEPVEIFYPSGYPAFLAALLKTGGIKAVFWGQAALYIITIILAWSILHLLEVPERIIFWSVSIIALHPYLIFNIKRIVQNSLLVSLMLIFTLFIVYTQKHKVSFIISLLFGILLGFTITVKPDLVILLPLVAIAIFLNNKNSTKEKLIISTIIILAGCVTISLIPFLLTGKLQTFSSPLYGSLAFFAGANQFSADAIWKYYNIDHAIPKALTEYNIPFGYRPYHVRVTQTPDVFYRLAFDYIKKHPLDYLYLTILKVFNLFRPDYRQIFQSETISSPALLFLVQTILASPIYIWLFSRLKVHNKISIFQGAMTIPLLILYILPYALIISDPRYRLPLDIILILDTSYCFNLIKIKKITI